MRRYDNNGRNEHFMCVPESLNTKWCQVMAVGIVFVKYINNTGATIAYILFRKTCICRVHVVCKVNNTIKPFLIYQYDNYSYQIKKSILRNGRQTMSKQVNILLTKHIQFKSNKPVILGFWHTNKMPIKCKIQLHG